MRTPRNISPLLDGFTLGDLLSQHGAARCYRATQNYSGKPFMVKMISLPASTAQLDALLITGSFSSPAEVNAYYKEQARDVLRNVQVLRHMATVGGFVDYDCVQVVPSEDGKGYEVYLLSPLRQTLSHRLQQADLSQMDVVNMALDLCAALTVCRRSGYCYTNLKPGNILRHGAHYHIGDLGFLPLYEIGHIPLPEQYRSSYTPPELMDGTRPVNDTADVYALGLILYQAFNGGILPGNDAVFGRLLLPPKYADYEMAEIILRACAPDSSIRWQGPEQMGRALMMYTQRNGMRDEPVIPPVLHQLASNCPVEEFLPEEPVENLDASPEWDEEFLSRSASRKKGHPGAKRSLPARRTRKSKKQKRSKAWIAIAILAAVLVLELILSIWIFS